MQRAAEEGDAKALYKLGLYHLNGVGTEKSRDKASDCFNRSAALNHGSAMYMLGCLEKDVVKAFEWFQKGAEQGCAQAQNNLGICYESGRGTPRNADKAFLWYSKAAESGYSEAQYNLATCYESGTGTAKDKDKANQYYREAARQGHVKAQERLKKKGLSW